VPVLALIVCAAPLAVRAPDVALAARDAGWDLHVIATPNALSWIDADRIREITGALPATEYRSPEQPKRDRPVAVVVCPITFNTANKLAVGIADNYALGVLCEALGAGHQIVAIATLNDNLSGHPAWRRSVDLLADRVIWVDARDGSIGPPRPVESGRAPQLTTGFDPSWALRPLGGTDDSKA
jgi:phosphopantothenoylcysteine synthetase/decarboxylase